MDILQTEDMNTKYEMVEWALAEQLKCCSLEEIVVYSSKELGINKEKYHYKDKLILQVEVSLHSDGRLIWTIKIPQMS